ncbi:MAG: fibronectin type III-like domain-contianing protein, partial [Clostridia bacterium]|nr:fibronectin type III-like domain-contianing protein [Clostridia bacterium]
TGKVDGYEVCQLYVSDPNPVVFKAKKELKGFEKVFIKAGESVKVTHTLDYRSFAFYNTAIGDWHATNGEYNILIGASSRDIKLQGVIQVKFDQEEKKIPDYQSICPCYYDIAHYDEIPSEQFAKLYGGDIPVNADTKRGYFDYNTTIGELKVCLIGKLIVKVAPSIIKSQVPNADITTMMMLKQGMEEMPLRGLVGISSGLIHTSLIDGMLMWGNKKYLRGIFKLIGGVFGTLGHILNKNAMEKRRKEGKAVMVNDVIKEIKQNEKEKKALEKEKTKLANKETKMIEKNEKREEKLAKKSAK